MADEASTAPSLTAIVLTRDDAVHIGRCVELLRGVARRVLVVDSFSSDRTTELARAAGADVVQRAFSGHADQYNWAAQSGITTDWIIWVDSDEYLEPRLAAQIRSELPHLPPSVSAVDLRRKVIFQGRWIRWGGHYDTILTRLWRPGRAHVEQRWMDMHLLVDEGETVRFRAGDIVDENLKDLTNWTEKHNRYTTLSMVDYLAQELGLEERVDSNRLTGPAALKRRLRNDLYRRSPLYARAVLYYLYRYFVRLGFLDGVQGFTFHTLQGLWNFLLVDAKIDEARRLIAREGVGAFLAQLEVRHGIQLRNPARPGKGPGG